MRIPEEAVQGLFLHDVQEFANLARDPAPALRGEGRQGGMSPAEPGASFEIAPAPIPDSAIAETVACDVVIVGAGISGTPAAMKAAEMGASVRVLEKGPTFGTHRTGGFAAFGTKAQKAVGVELPQELRERIVLDTWGSTMAFQGRLPLTSLWMRHSAEVADWLTDVLAAKGVEVRSVDTGGITGAGLERSLVRPEPVLERVLPAPPHGQDVRGRRERRLDGAHGGVRHGVRSGLPLQHHRRTAGARR